MVVQKQQGFNWYDGDFDWREEWKGMPEYIQGNRESKFSVVVHFENEADIAAFSEMIGRVITPGTKGVFYPVKKDNIQRWCVDEVDG